MDALLWRSPTGWGRSNRDLRRRPSAYLQKAGIEVLEVTGPDKHDRRARGKSDVLDAQASAHAAFAERPAQIFVPWDRREVAGQVVSLGRPTHVLIVDQLVAGEAKMLPPVF